MFRNAPFLLSPHVFPTLVCYAIDEGSFGFCRTTPQIALRAAKICVFVGITDLFCFVTELRMGIVRLHPANS
jgi:hypothetical protein